MTNEIAESVLLTITIIGVSILLLIALGYVIFSVISDIIYEINRIIPLFKRKTDFKKLSKAIDKISAESNNKSTSENSLKDMQNTVIINFLDGEIQSTSYLNHWIEDIK